MRFEVKSILVGRKKGNDDMVRPCFISMFDVNDPHKKNEVPKKILEFNKIHKIIIDKLEVNYLLPGNDLVINNLKYVAIKQEGPHLIISGEQY